MKNFTHTLLATTGASPQVVTETLYAIHQSNAQWPDAVFLITTSFGKEKAVQGLLQEGHLQRLCQQLQRPMPSFDESHVLVAPGADGNAVEDARSVADHEALANFIMTEVRNRTAQPQGSLHASLAGGRKTMTFYIGYAMSMFGRAQDTLSHVLVSEGYENTRDFWFPTSQEPYRFVQNAQKQTLDASLAQVTLAPIPFIRQRNDLPPVLLQNTSVVDFAQLVQLINLGENPQLLRLCVDLPEKCIKMCAADSNLCLEFKPGLLELAFYTLMARSTVEQETDLTRPSSSKADLGMASSLLEELMPICGLDSEHQISNNLRKINDWNIKERQLTDRTLDSLKTGMPATWFDSRKNKLSDLFAQQLPINLVRWITPSAIWDENGKRIPQDRIERTPKGGGYGINLQAHQISIVEK